MRALLCGIGVGFGVACWRQVPPLQPGPAPSGLLGMALLLLALAYFAGRARRPAAHGSSSSAVAVATAGAVSTAAGGSVIVNVALDQLTAAAWRGTAAPALVQTAAVELEADGWHGEELEQLDPLEVLERWENGSPLPLVADESR